MLLDGLVAQNGGFGVLAEMAAKGLGCLRLLPPGRDSYLFVGNDEAGRNLATLLTLVHSAQACGKNPRDYLADLIVRLPDHKMSRISELMPQNWLSPAERAQAAMAEQATSLSATPSPSG